MVRTFLASVLPASVKSSPFYQRIRSKFVSHDTIYNDFYYANDVEAPAAQAAPHVAKSIVHQFNPRTVVDVGCGTGAMLASLQSLGIRCIGLEYSSSGIRRCQERDLDVRKFNIENDKIDPAISADVAISFEVAEHIPARCADMYISLLCSLAPTIMISAAKPGQGGTDHVNLQPASYWIARFDRANFLYENDTTNEIASEWSALGVAGFYHENLMIFRKRNL